MQRVGSRVAAIAAFVVFAAACGNQPSTTTVTDVGITKDEIKIGATYPQSGTASFYYSVAKGANAYFAYINDKGGVNGRKINYVVLDDGYDPAKTPDKARELVQDQKIFAAFGTLGTPNNLAVRDYYNAQRVPQLFVFTGASIWGSEYDKYPYTIGWQPDYVTEAIIYSKLILADSNVKKIAILYQNDAYGQDGWKGFKTALGDKVSMVCGTCEAKYNAGDPTDMRSQVNALKASGADTFFVIATPGYAANAVTNAYTSGWKPKIYMNQVAASTTTWTGVIGNIKSSAPVDGMISTTYLKDPNSSEFANDSGVAQYKQILEKYCVQPCNWKDNFFVSGMAFAFSVVDVLKKAGNNLTRANVVKIASEQMNETDNFLLRPGIIVRTSKTHRFPISQLQTIKWTTDHWEPFGSVQDGRPG
jgi:branched-chain amino acid transport system substrate-binding protein